MRKAADDQLTSTTITLLNPCPKCGGVMRCQLMVGFGILKPQHQFCISHGCGYFNSISKEKHGK